ncbi:VENN motif pre-toxin domain-containing protein, partial [Gilliamella sp. B2717]|uniref:VENN motif pre-toxin domain-containing protein n=1 Tax=Gilliamella sp. B2717 TaxID=2817996 RepID=UPI00226A0812
IIRNKEQQKQDINELSRDTESANNPLKQIFDKQKELDIIETVELIKDIAQQAKSVMNKYDRIQAQNDVDKNKDALSKLEAEKAYNKLSDAEKAKYKTVEDYYNQNKDYFYYVAVDEQLKTNRENNKNLGGMGSDVSKGIDSAISIVTGIITGDITGGLAGASAPWVAEQIKKHTGHKDENGNWKTDDVAGNLIAHAILGAVVAELQGNSGLAGGAGAVTGELAADIIRKQLYGKDVKDLTEAEKQNISALAQLATGLAVASVGGDVGDVSTGIAAGKNAVENNLLSNERGVEKLNKENKKLYERIKDVVGYDEIDQLQKQYMNCQSDECKTAVYNDYYQKEQEAGQKLVDLYKSGQLTKADFEQLVTWYNDSMLGGVEEAKKEAGGNRNLWDIYDASSMDMTPAGLIGNPHLAEIRGLILLEEWRAEGLSESQIQEKFIKDGVLGAFGSGPDVNAIVHQIRNEGLSLEDGLKLATLGAYSKITNDASKGKKQQIAGKGTDANKPLDKTALETQHGKGNVEQGGGNYKETKDKILDNQATNQKANKSSKLVSM